MATGKFGSPSAYLFVAGYDFRPGKIKTLSYKHEALNEDTLGIGDTFENALPTGVNRVSLLQGGAFFDTNLGATHQVLAASLPSGPQAAVLVVCLGFAGQTSGHPFSGLEGEYRLSYDVQGDNGKLTKANVGHQVSGRIDNGVVLQGYQAFDGDFVSETYDAGAVSENGGAGYLQVFSSFGAFVGKIQHSHNASSWSDLIAFSTVTSSPTALRATVSGEVKRYLRFQGTVWGNVSPSASISPSASTSRSPSSSVSPSISASSSISPSSSQSASASISPTASLSPSTSLSPSVSASASPSPTTESGSQGQATVFCGFARY